MTDTDLFTAGGSGGNVELPNTVTTNISASVAGEGQAATQSQAAPRAAETTPTAAAPTASGGRSGSLSTRLLPELRAIAKEVGVEGASGMRKSELIAAIRARQNESNGHVPEQASTDAQPADPAPASGGAEAAESAEPQSRPRRRGSSRQAGSPGGADAQQTKQATEDKPAKAGNKSDAKSENKADKSEAKADQKSGQKADQDTKPDKSDGDQQGGGQNRGGNNNSDDDGEGRQGRRGRRFRDRRRRGERGGDGGGDTELREDDVVQPVAGILDVLDNYAFVRTSGYLAGPNDVYVSMNMVRKNGLRRGDAITGAVRVPREGEGGNQNPRQKFNPLVRIDSVNGGPVEDAKKRPDFGKLTPLYPNQRLRLETSTEKLTTRVIDLIMPVGKGQRALIVSPPKAGKTTILQDIANAITRNNPECHLMVVLVDERPEEVTDMQRSVKGEVIASTFDRPPSDHTSVAELAIERAKRLVEQGKDVVVLLDSITRLGRAYNNASPASGRILSGGVDSTALYPPKRFLGAARNIEEGGSLTIVATAMVETGSTGDTVIFEEFKGTGNAELKLDRKIAERRVFPAVDVNPSGTRKDELLLSPDEFAIVHKLRRVLSGLDSHQAIDLLMSQLRKTKNNYEFLVQVSKNTPGAGDVD